MAHLIGDRIARARRRIRVCSPVIAAGVVLGTPGGLTHNQHPEFKGVYDRTQMAEVLGQWRGGPPPTRRGPAVPIVRTPPPFPSQVTPPPPPPSPHPLTHPQITPAQHTAPTPRPNPQP